MTITVLLADDHALVRDGLKLLLEGQGDIKVVASTSLGRDAVKLCRDLKPQVALIDIAMPDLNGIDAAWQIHAENPQAKIIILSMYATSEYIYRALKAGSLGYILKESAGKEVVEAVRTVANGKRYLSQKISDLLIDGYINQGEENKGGSPIEQLSDREREVLQLVVGGKSSAEIAELLSLSVKSVETYRSRIMAKLGVKDITELVKFAIQHGLTGLD